MEHLGIIANAPGSRIAAVTLVIVAAVLCSGACVNDRERQPTVAAAGDNGSPSTILPSPVEGYIEFAATAGDPQSGLSDDQMAEGLRKLAGALGTVNAGDPQLFIDLRIGAEQILLNPASTETAAIIREALVAAADAIERGSEPDLALREAAESVRPDRPLNEQQVAVLHFFRRAADAIQRRSRRLRRSCRARISLYGLRPLLAHRVDGGWRLSPVKSAGIPPRHHSSRIDVSLRS